MIDWLRKYGWMILLVGVAFLVFVLSRGKTKPDIEAEVAAAQAHADAKKLEARLGRDEAKRKIEEQYADTIKKMDEEQKEQADRLRDDAAARARFYARVLTKQSRAS